MAQTLVFRKILFGSVVAFALPLTVGAAPSSSAPRVSLAAFKALAGELAPRVNLFRDIWQTDPDAEFFGGTSRDYLYWLKGKLTAARNGQELQAIVKDLRASPVIDVREFILYESDVDVISRNLINIQGHRYGVKKIDFIPADRLDPKTAAGRDELNQGFIPAEKIRLARMGLRKSAGFGDGAREIYEGRPTVHFAEAADFNSTQFAQAKINHPVLLALRYIRILAMNHYQTYGRMYPNQQALLETIDPASKDATHAVIAQSLFNGELKPYLANKRFMSWMNASIQKAFRSYTNPTAAKLLMEYFEADRLISTYEGLEPINQYLFRRMRDPEKIAENFRRFGIDEGRLFIPVARMFPDGHLYHGTKTETAFRSILFQGVLSSEQGLAGPGLYGVNASDLKFAEDWAGDPGRVVMFDLDPATKVVDVTEGYGARALEIYSQENDGAGLDGFAEAFGIDIIRYPYAAMAFVVKNGGVLPKVNGHKRRLMRFGELLEWAQQKENLSLKEILNVIADNGLNHQEVGILSQIPAFDRELKALEGKDFRQIFTSLHTQELLRSAKNVFVVPQIEAAFERSIRSLTTTQLGDPGDMLNGLVFGSEERDGIDRETRKHLRWIFVESIPLIFADSTTRQVERAFLAADRNKSFLGFYAALHETLRRSGSSVGAERIAHFIMEFRGEFKRGFHEGVHDAVANLGVPHEFSLSTWRRWALQQGDDAQFGSYIMERMWHKFGFGTAGNARFVKAMAGTDAGLRSLLHAYSEVTGSLGQKKVAFPDRWTALDQAAEESLYSAGQRSVRFEVDSDWYIYPWLQRALRIAPQRVRPEALVAAYDVVGRPRTKDPKDWIHHFEIHETVAQFPQLIKHKRGAAIFEEALAHTNFANTERLDSLLAKAIETTWKGHPRAPLWRQALLLERMNWSGDAGIVTREEFLADPALINNTETRQVDCGGLLI